MPLITAQVSQHSPILTHKRKTHQIIITSCSWKLCNINFWLKLNMRNSTFRQLVNLKFFRKHFCLHLHKTLSKGFKVIKIVMRLIFEEGWADILLKANFYWKSFTRSLLNYYSWFQKYPKDFHVLKTFRKPKKSHDYEKIKKIVQTNNYNTIYRMNYALAMC